MVEVVVASSSQDIGIASYDLRTGAERLRHRPCSSPPHGLLSVAGRFLACSQIPSGNTSPVLFYSWDKSQAEVRSFPAEPIGPLISNSDGTYIVGGGASGDIYFWEVASGSLINKWHAHYRAITCFSFSDDESMLISGSQDGSVRVWSLLMMFDDIGRQFADTPYIYSFSEHTLSVSDVAVGHGSSNSIIVSSSEDRTCKIWSLSKGSILRSVSFPSIINCILLDPGENVFFAGGRDGKIYIAALGAEYDDNNSYNKFIMGSLSDKSKAITCMVFSMDGITLVSGSEDGTIRVWDMRMRHVIRRIKISKGPVNNVIIVRQPLRSDHFTSDHNPAGQSKKRMHVPMPPPLNKFTDSSGAGGIKTKAVIRPSPPPYCSPELLGYGSFHFMMNQIKELQNGSGPSEMGFERLKQDGKSWCEAAMRWKKLCMRLQQAVCAEELLGDGEEVTEK